jgi:hypothetical protein
MALEADLKKTYLNWIASTNTGPSFLYFAHRHSYLSVLQRELTLLQHQTFIANNGFTHQFFSSDYLECSSYFST